MGDHLPRIDHHDGQDRRDERRPFVDQMKADRQAIDSFHRFEVLLDTRHSIPLVADLERARASEREAVREGNVVRGQRAAVMERSFEQVASERQAVRRQVARAVREVRDGRQLVVKLVQAVGNQSQQRAGIGIGSRRLEVGVRERANPCRWCVDPDRHQRRRHGDPDRVSEGGGRARCGGWR